MLPIAVTHLGLGENEGSTQAAEIVEALADEPYAVLLGDFNADPRSETLEILGGLLRDGWVEAGEGDGFTFPADTPASRIDYVMLSADWRTAVHAEVASSEASDHRPLVLDVTSSR